MSQLCYQSKWEPLKRFQTKSTGVSRSKSTLPSKELCLWILFCLLVSLSQWLLVISKLSSTSSMWAGSHILLTWSPLVRTRLFFNVYYSMYNISKFCYFKVMIFLNPLFKGKQGTQKMNYEFSRVRLGTKFRMLPSMSAKLKEEQMYISGWK